MSETMTVERELAHWKAWQGKADEIWGWQTPAGQARADRRGGLFRELGRMNSESIVLEVGCGTGEFTYRIAPHVKKLTATDLSPDLLAHAKERVTACCPQATVEFEPQDVMKMTLPEASFDSVFGCSMLHHVDPKGALKEIHRVLKPGGWCVFSEPNMLNPQIAVSSHVGFIRRRAGYSPDETAFFRWELEGLLEQAGYAEISVRNFDFLHPSTPRRWISTVARMGSILEKCPGLRAISGSLILCARKP